MTKKTTVLTDTESDMFDIKMETKQVTRKRGCSSTLFYTFLVGKKRKGMGICFGDSITTSRFADLFASTKEQLQKHVMRPHTQH